MSRGVLGTRDLLTGSFVPAVRVGAPIAVLAAAPVAAPALGIAAVALGVATVGLGIFNGVMSWKSNKKLNRLLDGQERQSRDIHELLDLVDGMRVDSEKRHAQVMAGFDRILWHDLQAKMFELNNRLEDLAARPITSDADRVLGLAGEAGGKIQSLLLSLPTGALDRAALVEALTFTRVAEADARLVMATEDPGHLYLASRLREKSTEAVSKELRTALRSNGLLELTTGDPPVPVRYWGLRAGLQALPVTQDAEEPEVLDIVWDGTGARDIRAALAGEAGRVEARVVLPRSVDQAEVLRLVQGAGDFASIRTQEPKAFLAALGAPKQSAAVALPALDALADSDWFDQFGEDYGASRPAALEGLGDELRDLIAEDDDGDECPWLESLVEAALNQYEAGGYDENRPMRADLVLDEAARLDQARPDLVDRAVVARAEQRLESLLRGFPGDHLPDPELARVASQGGIAVAQRAAGCIFRTCTHEGDLVGAADALERLDPRCFSAQDLSWLMPVLRQLETDPGAARILYTRWIGSDSTTMVRALAKARRATILLTAQSRGHGRKLIRDYSKAILVLSEDPGFPRNVLDELDSDFSRAKIQYEDSGTMPER